MAGQLIERGERTWLVRVYRGRDANGKRIYHNKTIRGTKKEAQRYLNKVLSEVDTGAFVEPTKQSVADFLRKWLDASAKQRVRVRTFADYQSHVERHFVPAFGGQRLSRLQPAQIQQLYSEMLSRGLSPRTVRYAHSTLRSALEQAVKWGELPRNPADLVELPQQRRKEQQVLSAEDVGRFLEASAGTRWHALWLLLITAGLRPGEALGLKWSDLEDGRIRVQRVLVRTKGGKWHFDEPKTDRSRRSVTLPETTARILREHRARQAQEKLRAGSEYQNHELVFASKNGQPLDFRLVARRYFKPLLSTAGLPPIRPYDLRHTHATLLLKAGEHVKIVSERLGHSSTVMTMDVYSHVLPDMQEATASRIETMLFPVANAS